MYRSIVNCGIRTKVSKTVMNTYCCCKKEVYKLFIQNVFYLKSDAQDLSKIINFCYHKNSSTKLMAKHVAQGER